MSNSAWLTARQIAELRLPELPETERGVRKRAETERWVHRDRNASGGGREYPVSTLPINAREALARRALASPAAMPALPPPRPRPASVGQLLNWQVRIMDARLALLGAIEAMQFLQGLSRTAAATLFAAQDQAGALSPDLAALVPLANARGGATGTRRLSARSLLRWFAEREAAGGQVVAVAPRDVAPPQRLVPAWAPALLQLRQRPGDPSLASCLEEMPEAERPSYDQAKRFLRSLSALDRNRGRMGPRAMRSMRPYVTRDYSDLWPTAIYVADGHTFDAEVAHPMHGQPFRPEVTIIIDVATRVIAGWSVALVENTWGVAEAMSHAFRTRGVCAIWYVDRGKGFNNHYMDDPATGFISRLGVHKANSAPYSSQARGVVERVHQSCLVRAAKRMPTYIGASMDPEAAHHAHKVTRADIKASGRSRLLMPWETFRTYIGAEIEAYNTRRHSELGMSPLGRWAKLLRDQPDTLIDHLSDDEARDAFRPIEERVARRGQVELHGKTYFLRDLEHFHGERVRVAFDIHDADRVWLSTLDGCYIGEAILDGNKRPFMPALTHSERVQRIRTQGRAARLEGHLRVVQAELSPPMIEHAPTIDPIILERAEQELARLSEAEQPAVPATPVDTEARPIFTNDFDWFAWLIANPTRVLPQDRAAILPQLDDPQTREYLDLSGVDVEALSRVCNAEARSA